MVWMGKIKVGKGLILESASDRRMAEGLCVGKDILKSKRTYTEDAGLPYFNHAAVIANGNWYYT